MAEATKVLTAKELMKKTKAAHVEQEGIYPEVDEMAKADAQIQHLKTEMKKYEAMFNEAEEKLLEKVGIEDYPADKELELSGKENTIKYGKKAEQKTIKDMEKTAIAFEQHQEGLFFKIAKVTLTDMNKYLDPVVLDQLIDKARTGRRTRKITQKV